MRIIMRKQGTGAHRYYVDVTPAAADEGDDVTITVTSENVPDGTNVDLVLYGVNVTTGDFEDGTLTHTVTIQGNTASVVKTYVSDIVWEGEETYVVEAREPGTGNVLATGTATINAEPVYPSMNPDSVSAKNIAVSGTKFLTADVNGSQAYVYDWQTGDRIYTYNDNDGSSSGWGHHVDAYGNYGIISEYNNSGDPYASNGSAHIVNISTGQYVRRVDSRSPNSTTFFGLAGAINQSYYVISSPFYSTIADTGKLFVYNLSGTFQRQIDQTNSTIKWLGNALSLNTNHVVLAGAYQTNGNDGGWMSFNVSNGSKLYTYTSGLNLKTGSITNRRWGFRVALGTDRGIVGSLNDDGVWITNGSGGKLYSRTIPTGDPGQYLGRHGVAAHGSLTAAISENLGGQRLYVWNSAGTRIHTWYPEGYATTQWAEYSYTGFPSSGVIDFTDDGSAIIINGALGKIYRFDIPQ